MLFRGVEPYYFQHGLEEAPGGTSCRAEGGKARLFVFSSFLLFQATIKTGRIMASLSMLGTHRPFTAVEKMDRYAGEKLQHELVSI